MVAGVRPPADGRRTAYGATGAGAPALPPNGVWRGFVPGVVEVPPPCFFALFSCSWTCRPCLRSWSSCCSITLRCDPDAKDTAFLLVASPAATSPDRYWNRARVPYVWALG